AALGPLAVLIIIAVGARKGLARTLGIVGAIVLLVSTIGRGIIVVTFPLLQQRLDLSVSALSLVFIPFAALDTLAIVLVAVAVVVGTRDRAFAAHIPPQTYRQP
ncbi:MAG: hypothetical protein L0G99_08305, partial [Propionibacteriales bacterium]|nr:hypothetical protein [Propionibacteriales bacterium]